MIVPRELWRHTSNDASFNIIIGSDKHVLFDWDRCRNDQCEAVLFDLHGNEEKIVYRKNEPIYDGSKVEQDMNVLWEKVLECLKELVQGYNKDDIIGISLTGREKGAGSLTRTAIPLPTPFSGMTAEPKT